ncbi:MAG: molybdopterin-dependent oxidoreductase [Anaerolineae bacterium]|nr:molybdopterin-dependent oxidoreductase [Anaerolineae bacterium]
MIRFTIDGQQVEVPEGTTVLRAADQAGIYIPRLCDHPSLTPYGGCRLCIVEVEGIPTLQTSCTLQARDGMVVYTNTPKVREAREFVLTMLFSERNHFCMYCQESGGDCELQSAAYGEDMTHWPIQPNWHPYPVDASHPDFVLDHNRCVLCRRCVRACAELVGNFTLNVRDRGSKTMIIADLDVPLGESSCINCGTCVQICPTGAFIDRHSAYLGLDAEVEQTPSVCVGCSVGCGIEIATRDNHLVRVDGDWEAPVNDGLLCEVGRYQPVRDERKRIVTPLIRKDGSLQEATWDEALNLVAEKLKSLAGRGSDGIAALASTRLPAEALYFFQQLFAEGLGSEMATSTDGHAARSVIVNGQAGSLEALKTADCVIVLGEDLVKDHQVAGFFVKRALPQGTRLIVIDSGENALHELANYSLRPRPETIRDLVAGILAASKGSDPSQPDVATTSQRTGVDADTIQAVAQVIALAQNPVFVCGAGAAEAAEELAKLATSFEIPVIGLGGGANSFAAAKYGLDKAFTVNGQQAAYLALGDDNPAQDLAQQLANVPFVAVQASYVSPVTDIADVVLPVEIWAELEGHYVNLEGRVQEARRALTPPAGVRSNTEVLQALAQRLGIALDGNWLAELGLETVVA